MGEKISRVFAYLFMGLIFLTVIAVAVLALLGCFVEATKTVVDTYTVECEVTQVAYAEEQVSRYSSEPSYKLGVRNTDFSYTFDINSTQFARYAVGDTVKVKVSIFKLIDGSTTTEYKLIG